MQQARHYSSFVVNIICKAARTFDLASFGRTFSGFASNFAVRCRVNKDHSRNTKCHLTFCVSFIIHCMQVAKKNLSLVRLFSLDLSK